MCGKFVQQCAGLTVSLLFYRRKEIQNTVLQIFPSNKQNILNYFQGNFIKSLPNIVRPTLETSLFLYFFSVGRELNRMCSKTPYFKLIPDQQECFILITWIKQIYTGQSRMEQFSTEQFVQKSSAYCTEHTKSSSSAAKCYRSKTFQRQMLRHPKVWT